MSSLEVSKHLMAKGSQKAIQHEIRPGSQMPSQIKIDNAPFYALEGLKSKGS